MRKQQEAKGQELVHDLIPGEQRRPRLETHVDSRSLEREIKHLRRVLIQKDHEVWTLRQLLLYK